MFKTTTYNCSLSLNMHHQWNCTSEVKLKFKKLKLYKKSGQTWVMVMLNKKFAKQYDFEDIFESVALTTKVKRVANGLKYYFAIA